MHDSVRSTERFYRAAGDAGVHLFGCMACMACMICMICMIHRACIVVELFYRSPGEDVGGIL